MKNLLRTLLLLSATAATACGNWSDDDIEFLRVVPSRAELRLTAPEAGSSTSGLGAGEGYGSRRDALGRSNIYEEHVLRATRELNGFVDGLTSGIDFIRSHPPTERKENLRIWGPFDAENRPRFESRFVLEKVGEAEFTYRIEQRLKRTTEFTVVSEGRFKGEKARNGEGSISLHVGRARLLGTSDDRELATVTLTYDMSGGAAQALLQVERADDVRVGYGYQVRPDGGGSLVFDLPSINFPGTATLAAESIHLSSQWLGDRSGRVDIKVSGGDLGSFEGRYAECWSTSFQQVYREANFGCPAGASRCHEGRIEECTIEAP